MNAVFHAFNPLETAFPNFERRALVSPRMCWIGSAAAWREQGMLHLLKFVGLTNSPLERLEGGARLPRL